MRPTSGLQVRNECDHGWSGFVWLQQNPFWFQSCFELILLLEEVVSFCIRVVFLLCLLPLSCLPDWLESLNFYPGERCYQENGSWHTSSSIVRLVCVNFMFKHHNTTSVTIIIFTVPSTSSLSPPPWPLQPPPPLSAFSHNYHHNHRNTIFTITIIITFTVFIITISSLSCHYHIMIITIS